MNFLIIGLGSMGKRRIRNLKALGHNDIVGFDLREDRRKEAAEKYGIRSSDTLSKEVIMNASAVIISTPPDKHEECIDLCIKYEKPCLVEASIILGRLPELCIMAQKNNVLVAPSCTMRFHPCIKAIKDIVRSKKFGRVTNFTYHSGQYLPDWHPWEKISDYYVSRKETGACREIVTFELTWLLDIMGAPQEVFSFYAKASSLDTDIEDVYNILLKFKGSLGVLVVDINSRFATRSLILNMEKAQLRWNWEDHLLNVFDANTGKWSKYARSQGAAAAGYNENIIENMYIEEVAAFVKAATKGESFPNALKDDIEVLKIFESCQKSNNGVRL